MARTPIFGPFDVSRSSNVSDNRLMNLFPEIVETKQGKAIGALYSTAGLSAALATLGAGPVRALHPTSHYGLFALSGTGFYKIEEDFTTTLLLSGIAQQGPATIIDNGTQVALFVGDAGILWSESLGVTGIPLPFDPASPISATYQDGFGLINQPGTALWWQSDLLDLGVWNALNFGSATGDPDDVVAIEQLNREIWLIKQTDTEIWYNAGTANFSFARLDGVYLEAGCAAQASLVQLGETLVWLARNREGHGVVVRTRGHQLERISTHAIEAAIQGYDTISDAVGYAYQQAGHQFYVLNFPTGDATWVYDVTESLLAGVPMWHQRGAFNTTTGRFERHWGNCHAFFAGRNVVGDRRNGNLYAFEPDALTDAGATRKWLRSWRALAQPAAKPVRFSQLQIDMQTGIGVPDGTRPQVVLRWSDDGGHVWSAERYAAAGESGQTARRVMFRRMGSAKRNSGLDRIFELSSTDQFPVAIIGAELEAG